PSSRILTSWHHPLTPATSLENAAAIAPGFNLGLPVLRRCIRAEPRRAVGQRRERKVDIAHETDVAVTHRLAADLRALLLDELRELIAIGRAEPLDAGERDGLASDLEGAGIDHLLHRAAYRHGLRLWRRKRHWLRRCRGRRGGLRRELDRRRGRG